MVDGDVEIVPTRTGKAGTDLIIQADLAVPFERELHRRPQDVVALFISDPPSRDDADDIVRQFRDDFDHRVVLFAATQLRGFTGERVRVSPKSVAVRGIRT
jgi:hypothetical protein